jgi:aminoglycoside phosphotransferase family enzyme/predicted kinase
VNATEPRSPLDSPAARKAFIAAMQSKAPYAALHPVPGDVSCIETHISWVFLTGPYAYKLKKPLRLPFLDYSTADRRAALCREELRLNRRHAPGLYVDVVPITGTPGHPVVGGDERLAFEHALRMVQFDPALELTHLLQARRVEPAAIAALGESLARMHAEAERAVPGCGYGAPAAVHRVTLENFVELETLLQGPDSTRLVAVRSRLDTLFAHGRDLMRRRCGRDCVRECHGDLHCGNVVCWQGRLVAFDGLEFDPALRYVDVASDIAFLAMDLGARGRDDLRRVLLDAWTSASGDYEAIALLAYYEAYRALVRAKVTALRRQQVGDAVSNANASPDYLGWIQHQAQRRAPTLVVLAGLSGSGKTTLARRLGPALEALHVRSDVERKRLAGLGPLESSRSAADAGIYAPAFNERTYDRLAECVDACLAGGESVIVDAANLRRHERERFAAIAAARGAPIVLVHCTAPLEVLRARVAQRAATEHDASEATVGLLDRQPGYWESLTRAELEHALVVDTREPTAVAAAIDTLAQRCAPGLRPHR